MSTVMRGAAVLASFAQSVWRHIAQAQISWSNWFSLLVAMATAYLVYRQIHITRAQDILSNRQLEIAETQNKIVLAQLEKKGDLALEVSTAKLDFEAGTLDIRVMVGNTGTRSVADYYWNIGIESAVATNIRFMHESTFPFEMHQVDIADVACISAREKADGPLYPTRRALVCLIRLQGMQGMGTYRLFTKLVYEDGAKPAGDGFATTTLTLSLVTGVASVHVSQA